jgi:hypothetical protein
MWQKKSPFTGSHKLLPVIAVHYLDVGEVLYEEEKGLDAQVLRIIA